MISPLRARPNLGPGGLGELVRVLEAGIVCWLMWIIVCKDLEHTGAKSC